MKRNYSNGQFLFVSLPSFWPIFLSARKIYVQWDRFFILQPPNSLKLKNGAKSKREVHKTSEIWRAWARRGWARKKQDRQRGGRGVGREKKEKNGKKDGCIGALVHRWRLTKEESLGTTRRNWFPYWNVLAGNAGQWWASLLAVWNAVRRRYNGDLWEPWDVEAEHLHSPRDARRKFLSAARDTGIRYPGVRIPRRVTADRFAASRCRLSRPYNGISPKRHRHE